MYFIYWCELKISFDRNVGKSFGYMIYRVVVELKFLKIQVVREYLSLKKVLEILVKFLIVLVWSIFFSVKLFC